MDREIRFRAWDDEDKDMFIPDIICNDDSELNCGVFDSDGGYRYLRSVLMQYTGLKDKNGVEIYEGDIVKFMDEHYEIIRNGVRYDLRPVEVSILNGSQTFPFVDNTIDHLYEIIGNIYENPELLEEEENPSK